MTQEEKIIGLMIAGGSRSWYYPMHFMQGGLGEYFVGYEASARMTDICRKYPQIIEQEKKGKYRVIRLAENFRDHLEEIPTEMAVFIRHQLLKTLSSSPEVPRIGA